MEHPVAIGLLTLAQICLAIPACIGWATVGIRPWVKVLFLSIVPFTIATLVLVAGPVGFLAYAGGILLFQYVGLSLARLPREAPLLPLPPQGPHWPEHGQDELIRWTKEFMDAGFVPFAEGYWRAIPGSSTGDSFARFFRHATEPIGAAIYVKAKPKTVGRSLFSEAAAGQVAHTSGQMTDYRIFPEKLIHAQTLKRSTAAQLLDAHRAMIATLGPLVPVVDPIALQARIKSGWVQRNVQAGHLRVEGPLLALPPKGVLGVMRKTVANMMP